MKTRFLNNSPLSQIVEDDCSVGSYPQILRTGDSRQLGNDLISYDDGGTQLSVTQDVLMPYNLAPSFVNQLGGHLTGSIQISKTPNLSTQFLKKVNKETIEPFKESRNPVSFYPSSSFTGFDESEYPGFQSPGSSQIAVVIDISPDKEYLISKGRDTKDNVDFSGFVYFNFEKKSWDYIGMKDPATGASTGYASHFTSKVKTSAGISYPEIYDGHERIVRQFTNSPGIGARLKLDAFGYADLDDSGYDKIGFPTGICQAPWAPRYHAKDSQTLKLSNYIQHPFILERVVVQLPVAAERYQGDPWTYGALDYADGFGRDIDNHVFFIYRQSRSTGLKDTVHDVSSSVRSLVANESFCFYNARSLPDKPALPTPTAFEPIHPVGYKSNYNMTRIATNTTVKINASNMVLNFRPKNYNEQITAPSAIKLYVDNGLTGGFNNGYIRDFWAGGSSPNSLTGTLTTTQPIAYKLCTPGLRTVQTIEELGTYTSSSINFNELVFDERNLRSFTYTDNSKDLRKITNYFEIPGLSAYRPVTSDSKITYKETPYVLFPEDELIFGIDTGFFNTIAPNTVNTWLIQHLPPGYGSGSSYPYTAGDTIHKQILYMLKQEAKVILYGTLIKDGVEKLGSLNQDLTSTAVHEIVHEVITDEFQIEQNSVYSGSYLSGYLTGTFGSNTAPREFVNQASNGDAYPFKTIVRYGKHKSITSTLYENDLNIFRKDVQTQFRYDRFGQFRDMLEQPRDTKRYDTSFVQKNTGLVDFSKTSFSSLVSSPATCLFVSQSTDKIVSPIDTRSSNLSTEFTCSLPFFDEIFRNRSGSIAFNKNPAYTPTTIILNKPSTLLSST